MNGQRGFDNDLYVEQQSAEILKRVERYNNRLYLEFGGKLLFDYHAARVLPGYEPNVKIRLLQSMKEQVDLILCIHAGAIERKKIRADFGITYESDALKLIDDIRDRGIDVLGVVITRFKGQPAAEVFRNKLERRGIKVEYAIHPVAGRMPGHMNVLLAEADVPYEELIEMDDINPTMSQVDVAIVLGANDVVNPVARTDPSSPIAGMPIIDVDKARTVVVIKRSLSPGFAGIPNPLFAMENTLMFFNDGKKAILELLEAVKEL